MAKIASLVATTLKYPGFGWMPYVWLVFLAYLFISPILGNRSWFEWAITMGSIVVFLPLYFAQFSQGRGHPARALALNAAIALLGFALLPINPGANTYVIFSAAGAPFALKPRAAAQYLLALIAVVAVEMFLVPPFYRYWMGLPTIILVATIGGTNIYQAERLRQAAKLRRAQEDVEEMAKVAERERIARDLHDLLGHTLSVITLKSELASKLADIDPKRAAEEIREVERVSRETLTEVRRAVEGYGQHGLKGELHNAGRALHAAGVRLEIQAAPLELPPKPETVLAMALREAITNVVRHARATRCHLRLEADGRVVTLTVEDDGRGGAVVEGSGLTGMRSRVAHLGGSVEIDGRNGMRLRVTVPSDVASPDVAS